MAWKTELTSTVSACAVLHMLILASMCTSTQQTSIDEMIEASGKRKASDPLQCHVCHSETQRNCYNFTESGEDFFGFPQQCDGNTSHCVVRKFSFTLTDENGTLPMKTFAVKRNCSPKCEPGCVIMGERTRLYVCNSCCQTALCNTDNGAESLHRRNSRTKTFFIWKQVIVSGFTLLSIILTSSQFNV